MRGLLKFLGIVFLIFVAFSILGGVMRWIFPDKAELKEANIAVLEITGVIRESLPVLEQIREILESKNIKATIVRVESPGGAVGAAQEIYLELKKLKTKMPVIISMGDVAASGGLYVAIAGTEVIALPGTLTGSMGVLLELVQVNRLLEKLYIDPVTLKSGELKDAGSPTSALNPKARVYLQALIQKNFETFRNTVKQERSLTPEAVAYLSDGRVVDGEDALKWGLVDKIGTFSDAIDSAKERAKISEEPKLVFVSREPKAFWERLIEKATSPLAMHLRNSHKLLQYRWDPLGQGAL